MKKKITLVLSGLIYDVVSLLLILLGLFLSLFIPKLRNYIRTRANIFSLRSTLKKITRDEIIYLFCSSIGDLEQTIPLLNELEQRNAAYFIFLHSPNGYNHAQKLGYTQISFTPFDLFISWAIIFSGKRPSACIINRHEFWPGFVVAATVWSKLYIINAVQKERRGIAEGLFEKWVYGNSRKVFFVNNLFAPSANEILSGDTRMDRLNHRYLSEQPECNQLIEKFRDSGQKILVIGNAYQSDVVRLNEAIDRNPAILAEWKILIIPSRPVVADKMTDLLGSKKDDDRLQVIPVMGKLFQYYSCADLAWVGGGFAPTGIHNTLEPSFFGINLISGPNLDNQPDAIMYKKRNVLTIFNNADELEAILKKASTKTTSEIIYQSESPTKLIANEIFSL